MSCFVTQFMCRDKDGKDGKKKKKKDENGAENGSNDGDDDDDDDDNGHNEDEVRLCRAMPCPNVAQDRDSVCLAAVDSCRESAERCCEGLTDQRALQVVWQTDTSAEAAKARAEEQLSAAMSSMVIVKLCGLLTGQRAPCRWCGRRTPQRRLPRRARRSS